MLAEGRLTLSLRLFGGFELSDERDRRDWIPVQPKPAAILSYLALAEPRLVRRDALVALFWPELDSDHARGALSKALHHLRRSLGENVLEVRGDDDVGIARDALRVDAVAFQERLAAGHQEEALEEYRGELLAGFHCSGSLEFERWLDRERSRLNSVACTAARTLAESATAEGDVSGALHWSRRATELDVYDESSTRLRIRLLAQSGNHAAAIRTYRDFERRLAEELEIEPSYETRVLIESVRQEGRAVAERVVNGVALPSIADAAAVGERVRSSHGAPAHAGDRPAPTFPSTLRRLAHHATAPAFAAAIVLGGFLALRVVAATRLGFGHATVARPDPTAVPPPYSVAVLPFTELAASKDGGYLAYGVTEEVTNALGRVSGLLVSYAPAAATFSGAQVSLAEVGRQLRVSSIVAGTIERRNGGLRLVMQLSNASSGALLWRRTYDVTDRELPGVYGDAAREVRAALAPESATGKMEAGSAVSRTANRRAYQAYLLGRYEQQKRSAEGARRALEHFEQAIREDSSYVDAFAALAMGFALRAIYREGSTREERIAGLNAAASRALALDSTSAAAWTALGVSRFLDEWDWRGSEAAFRRALALHPSHATAYDFYSQLLVATGRLREGEAALERMRALDPLTSGSGATYGLVLYHLRRYDESAQVLRGVVQRDSSYENGFAFLTRPLLMLGRERELAAVLQHQLAEQGWPDPADAQIVARAVTDTTLMSETRRVLDRWRNAAPLPFGPVQQARIRSRLGDHDGAIAMLELAHRTRDPAIYAIGADPAFDLLRSEPRFQAILKAMGLEKSR